MTSIAAGDGAEFGPAAENLGRRRAAGIYGAIITAAILDTAGDKCPPRRWRSRFGHVAGVRIAEEYAEVLGEQAAAGQLPSRASILEALASTWPMVTASYLPLLAVVLATLAGASALTAANAGLVAIVLRTVHGWLAGRAGQLQRGELLVATSIAAGLGPVVILLKDLILVHLL